MSVLQGRLSLTLLANCATFKGGTSNSPGTIPVVDLVADDLVFVRQTGKMERNRDVKFMNVQELKRDPYRPERRTCCKALGIQMLVGVAMI